MSLGLKYKNNEQIFVERQRGGVPYLSYPLLENTGIVNHGFSTRLGAGNRRRSGRFYLYAADTYNECKARVRQGEGTVLS